MVSIYWLIAKAFCLISGPPVRVRVEFHMIAIVPIDEINMVRIFHLLSFSAWCPNLIV